MKKVPMTHQIFDHIESVLCTPAAIAEDRAFHLEVALRRPIRPATNCPATTS